MNHKMNTIVVPSPYSGGCKSAFKCDCGVMVVCDSGYATEDPKIHKESKNIHYVHGPCCCATIECPDCAAKEGSKTKQRNTCVEQWQKSHDGYQRPNRIFLENQLVAIPPISLKEEDFNRATQNYYETNDAFGDIYLSLSKKSDLLKIRKIFEDNFHFNILDIEAWMVWEWYIHPRAWDDYLINANVVYKAFKAFVGEYNV